MVVGGPLVGAYRVRWGTPAGAGVPVFGAVVRDRLMRVLLPGVPVGGASRCCCAFGAAKRRDEAVTVVARVSEAGAFDLAASHFGSKTNGGCGGVPAPIRRNRSPALSTEDA